MKTQKTIALIELLDHTRLVSPGEIAKIENLIIKREQSLDIR